MQDEYDFSNAERGKFYRSETALQLPIYLDPDVREYLAVRAKAKGIAISQLVNEILRKSIQSIQIPSDSRVSAQTQNLYGSPEARIQVRLLCAQSSAEEATPDGADNTAERLTSHP